MTHDDARFIILRALSSLLGRDPTAAEVYAVQCVSLHETRYGQGWTIKGAVGSHNWGAITAGKQWTGETFEHRDSYPNDKGENIWYTTKFRRYPTDHDGALDVAKFLQRMGVLEAANSGRTYRSVAERMYLAGYYKGFGATVSERIGGYERALANAGAAISRALNENAGLGAQPVEARVIPTPKPPVIPFEQTLQATVDDAVRIALGRA